LKFGVYLSPWDRNHPAYGSGKPYNDYFCGQLTEILTHYGDIFSVWFDGACGEGPNGKKQVYDWPRYYEVVRSLQPGACICVCGPDIRWCGNEAGDTRPAEWSVVPHRLCRAETVEGKSQRQDGDDFRQKRITSSDADLGSREALKDEDDLIWYPAEVNTSIRPGWFYHAAEDDRVKSFEELWHVYLNSVGGNATFLLNLPPDRRGLIHENDVACLKRLGDFIRETFRDNIASEGALSSPDALPGYGADGLTEMGYDAYFRPAEGVTETRVDVRWDEPRMIGYVVLQENIRMGQRVERFDIVAEDESGNRHIVADGTVIGYKRIVRLPEAVRTRRLSIVIRDARVFPTLAFLGVYAPQCP
jgi:alpha-L-fucosidase